MNALEFAVSNVSNCPFAIDEKIIKKLNEVAVPFSFKNSKSFTILGQPKAWQRHRASRFSGMYDPNVPVKSVIQNYFKEELGPDFSMIHGPIALFVDSYKQIPKSMPKYEQLLYELKYKLPVSKPDVDNYAKLIQDAINKIVYDDDAQIISLVSNKYLSFTPRVEITMKWND